MHMQSPTNEQMRTFKFFTLTEPAYWGPFLKKHAHALQGIEVSTLITYDTPNLDLLRAGAWMVRSGTYGAVMSSYSIIKEGSGAGVFKMHHWDPEEEDRELRRLAPGAHVRDGTLIESMRMHVTSIRFRHFTVEVCYAEKMVFIAIVMQRNKKSVVNDPRVIPCNMPVMDAMRAKGLTDMAQIVEPFYSPVLAPFPRTPLRRKPAGLKWFLRQHNRNRESEKIAKAIRKAVRSIQNSGDCDAPMVTLFMRLEQVQPTEFCRKTHKALDRLATEFGKLDVEQHKVENWIDRICTWDTTPE